MMGYGWNGGGWGWGAWVFMSVFMVLFWTAIAFGVVMLVRHNGGGRSSTSQPLTPPDGFSGALRILDERFARGEIDSEEYTSRRDLLRRQ